ncbi:MAG: tetratricopeptide repeat protein [Geobacteraceae bacterium]|nr:tetratricopeptide repeat protein [Geobacteraceae bacterium]
MRSIFLIMTFLTVAVCTGCSVLEASQKKASYHYQMGLSFLAEGNYTRALIDFTEAEKITPDDPLLLNYLGQVYFLKKRYDLAETRYLRAIAIRPAFSDARNNLGVNYLEMKRWDDAINQLTIVKDDIFYQNHDAACMNLALAYFGKGDYATALTLLRPVVSSNPRNPVARMNLGRVYFADEKIGLAIAEFKKSIELNRDYARAHYNLALAYLKIQETASAKAEFNEVIRIDADGELGQLSREYLEMLK